MLLALEARNGKSSTNPVLDAMVEYDVHNCPRAVVDASCGWDIVRANEDQRPVELLEPILFGIFPSNIGDNRHQCSDPEEVQEAAVDLACTV